MTNSADSAKEIIIPQLPEPSVIRRAIADKKAEIGQLKKLLRLAELQALKRQMARHDEAEGALDD